MRLAAVNYKGKTIQVNLIYLKWHISRRRQDGTCAYLSARNHNLYYLSIGATTENAYETGIFKKTNDTTL